MLSMGSKAMHRQLAKISCIALTLMCFTSVGCKTTQTSKVSPAPQATEDPLHIDQPVTTASNANIAQQNKTASDSTTSENQQAATQETQEENPSLLNDHSKRVVLSWASDALIRAQSILHGSDDLPLLIEAAMDNSKNYRKTLAKHLSDAGASETQRDQTLTKVEDHIRTMTRDFILKARTLLKRQAPSKPKQQNTDQLIT